MFWKLFKLQALLDSLFDDGWLSLDLAFDGYTEQAYEAAASSRQA